MDKSDFPNFKSLITGLFNQDWRMDHDSWVDCFCDQLSRGGAIWKWALIDEIQKMVGNHSESEIEEFFRSNHAEIEPDYDAGMTHLAWLEEVQRLISEDLERHPEKPL